MHQRSNDKRRPEERKYSSKVQTPEKSPEKYLYLVTSHQWKEREWRCSQGASYASHGAIRYQLLILVGLLHPQPPDCLCFYHVVIAIAKGKGKRNLSLVFPLVFYNDKREKSKTNYLHFSVYSFIYSIMLNFGTLVTPYSPLRVTV